MKDLRHTTFFLFIGLIGVFGLVACTDLLPTPTPFIPTDTITPSASPTSTNTIIWFPPTSTPTPFIDRKQPTPTLQVGPDERVLIFEDKFDQEDTWGVYREETGSAAFGKNELTIAVSQPKNALSSFRSSPFPSDYYLEISASPSLCRGDDTYGVILRVINEYNYYRFIVSCSGQLRFEWVRDGRSVPLQDWIPSKTAFMGPSAKSVIGVWAVKREVRLYINNVYQFSVYGLTQTDGNIGVYVRSTGETAVTVNFSDLKVFEGGVLPPTPTAVPTVIPSVTPTIRTP